MRRYIPISEDDFFLTYLQSEWSNPAYDHCRRQFSALIEKPDLEDPRENYLRRRLLGETRWKVLVQLPASICWYTTKLKLPDLARCCVLRTPHFESLCRDSAKIPAVAKAVKALLAAGAKKQPVGLQKHLNKINAIAEALDKREKVPFGLILLAEKQGGPFWVIEGTHRLLALALLSPGKAAEFKNFKAVVGIAPKLDSLFWFQT